MYGVPVLSFITQDTQNIPETSVVNSCKGVSKTHKEVVLLAEQTTKKHQEV